MKIIISPAKTLDFVNKPTLSLQSQPQFGESADQLMQKLRSLTPVQLKKLMSLSDKLAAQVFQYNQQWQWPHPLENAKAAAYLFRGDVYLGLEAYKWSAEQAEKAQQRLRILSGLYGLLRPFDYIMPYRLEMGRQFGIKRKSNLYQYWRESVNQQLEKELESSEGVLVNLASKEYFAAVDTKRFSKKICRVEFKDFSRGRYKIISFYAKKARGLMANWIICNDITRLQDLCHFDVGGYYFQPEENAKNTLVFYRDSSSRA